MKAKQLTKAQENEARQAGGGLDNVKKIQILKIRF